MSSLEKSLEQYVVELDEPLSNDNQIGRGCYGAVYKSKLNGAKCVVKELRDVLTVSEDQWRREVVEKFVKKIELLSRQRHPNIVQFLGVCGLDGDSRDVCLVIEQLDTDLKGFIENNRGGISLCIKLNILRDVTCGVSHLHSSGVVHRDLNAGNVLLTTSLQAKITADLLVIDSHQFFHKSLATINADYMPPESEGDSPAVFDDPKLDCFSFGHLMLYLVLEVSFMSLPFLTVYIAMKSFLFLALSYTK